MLFLEEVDLLAALTISNHVNYVKLNPATCVVAENEYQKIPFNILGMATVEQLTTLHSMQLCSFRETISVRLLKWSSRGPFKYTRASYK